MVYFKKFLFPLLTPFLFFIDIPHEIIIDDPIKPEWYGLGSSSPIIRDEPSQVAASLEALGSFVYVNRYYIIIPTVILVVGLGISQVISEPLLTKDLWEEDLFRVKKTLAPLPHCDTWVNAIMMKNSIVKHYAVDSMPHTIIVDIPLTEKVIRPDILPCLQVFYGNDHNIYRIYLDIWSGVPPMNVFKSVIPGEIFYNTDVVAINAHTREWAFFTLSEVIHYDMATQNASIDARFLLKKF